MTAKKKTATETPAAQPPRPPAELVASWDERRELFTRIAETAGRIEKTFIEGMGEITELLKLVTRETEGLVGEMTPYAREDKAG